MVWIQYRHSEQKGVLIRSILQEALERTDRSEIVESDGMNERTKSEKLRKLQ